MFSRTKFRDFSFAFLTIVALYLVISTFRKTPVRFLRGSTEEKAAQKEVHQDVPDSNLHFQPSKKQPNEKILSPDARIDSQNTGGGAVKNRIDPKTYESNTNPVNSQAIKLHKDVNIVPSFPSPSLKLRHRDCVPLPQSPLKTAKICIHPVKDDEHVSATLKLGRLWEQPLVLSMMRVLKSNPDMMLIDIGMNIGEYTLMAAALGRQVLAVEMVLFNVNLVQTSLQLSHLEDKVTLVNNALYLDHRQLTAKITPKNIGGTGLETLGWNGTKQAGDHVVTFNTICLDDLTPLVKGRTAFMKMDIENSEHYALAVAGIFFDSVDIKVVQMEWLRRPKADGDIILKFMSDHGYAASSSAHTYTSVIPGVNNKNFDVYFLKKSHYGIS